MVRIIFPLACLALFGGSQSAWAQEFVPGRILVRYRSERPLAREQKMGLHMARGIRRLAAHTHLYEVPQVSAEDTLDLVAEAKRDPEVLYAEPDYIRHKMGTTTPPNDPEYPNQWALPMIRAPQAW